MSECLHDELAPTVEIEESMRNGVILARLANFFAPKIVTERKIFDRDEDRLVSGNSFTGSKWLQMHIFIVFYV